MSVDPTIGEDPNDHGFVYDTEIVETKTNQFGQRFEHFRTFRSDLLGDRVLIEEGWRPIGHDFAPGDQPHDRPPSDLPSNDSFPTNELPRRVFKWGFNKETYELAAFVAASFLRGEVEIDWYRLLTGIEHDWNALPESMPKNKKKKAVLEELKREIVSAKKNKPARKRVRKSKSTTGYGDTGMGGYPNFAGTASRGNGTSYGIVAGSIVGSSVTPYWIPEAMKNGLRVRFRQQLYIVGGGPAGVAINGVALVASGNTSLTTVAYFEPAITTYYGKHLLFESAMWSKYRVKELTFKYMPAAAATSTQQAIYLYANSDPAHPAFAGTPPTWNALISAGAVMGNVWEELSIKVENIDKDWRYVVANAATDVRFEAAAGFTLLTGSSIATGVVVGNLFAEGVIEFCDPGPVSTSVSFDDSKSPPQDKAALDAMQREWRLKQYREDMASLSTEVKSGLEPPDLVRVGSSAKTDEPAPPMWTIVDAYTKQPVDYVEQYIQPTPSGVGVRGRRPDNEQKVATAPGTPVSTRSVSLPPIRS